MLSKAFILCGGKGTRLRPLTYEVQKVMVPVNGKPLVEHNVELLKNHNLRSVVLGIGHLGHQIKNHFKDSWNGMEISYSEEKEPLGTGGALKLAEKYFNETFVMANGDEIKTIDITKMYEQHKKNNALATLALVEVENTEQYGIVKLSGDKILNFVEKPKPEKAPSNLASAGLYILEPEVLGLIPEGKASIEKDVFPKIVKMGKLFGFSFQDRWLTTDTHERLDRAKRTLETQN